MNKFFKFISLPMILAKTAALVLFDAVRKIGRMVKIAFASDTMNRFFKFISPPVNAVRTAALVLFDAAKDICSKVNLAFAGGPMEEISDYWFTIRSFSRRRYRNMQKQFRSSRDLLFKKARPNRGKRSSAKTNLRNRESQR